MRPLDPHQLRTAARHHAIRARAVDGFDHITDLFIAHLHKRQEAEWDALSCILADPRDGYARVRPLPLEPYHFEDDDLRLIYSAVCVAADRGRDVVIRLAWRALAEARGGERRAPHAEADAAADDNPRVGRWSWRQFVSFACRHPSAALAADKARRLIDLYERHREAQRCWRKIHDLLRGDHRPWGGVVIAPPIVKRKTTRLHTERNRTCFKSSPKSSKSKAGTR